MWTYMYFLLRLGIYVWRYSDGRDGLYQDVIGPSSYRKGQGIPVRLWGVLADGVLHVTILPQGWTFDAEIFSDIVDEHFEEWVGTCDKLVADYEGFLRSPEALQAYERIGISLVDDYPKVSQDFNPIENAWKILHDRLNITRPSEMAFQAFASEPRDCATHTCNMHTLSQQTNT